MTELETQLLHALEQLQQDYAQQLQQWSSTCRDLKAMYDTTQKQNLALHRNMKALHQQLQRLNVELQTLNGRRP